MTTLEQRAASWMDQANCIGADPDLFYPERGTRDTDAAKAICRECAVRLECLEYALNGRERHGVWGGKTERQRRVLRRQRRLAMTR